MAYTDSYAVGDSRMWYSASNGEVAIVLAFSSQKASTLAIAISLEQAVPDLLFNLRFDAP